MQESLMVIIESNNKNKYVYDNLTGQIFFVSDSSSAQNVVKYYHNKLNITDSVCNNIELYKVSSGDVKQYLIGEANGFRQLILEVTSACNLRCRYCIYSEHYNLTRTHGNEMMSFDIAKKAIDYYFQNFEIMFERNPMRKPIIGFCGGEPLVNFELIKKSVKYISENYRRNRVLYNITTNGILLDDKVQNFLVDNNFSILVSLDGSKEMHDRNRVDKFNNGTFDRIKTNLDNFSKKYPSHMLSLSVCFDYKTDMVELGKFIDSLPYRAVTITKVASENTDYYSQFSEKDERNFFNSLDQFKKNFYKAVEDNDQERSIFAYTYFNAIFGDFAFHPMVGESSPKIRPFTGTCIPGEKIYVDVNGKYKVCEKINSSFDIGDINCGIDFESSARILEEYNRTIAEHCNKCQVSRLCKQCFRHFLSESGFSKSDNNCAQQKRAIISTLTDYVNLLENDPKLFERVTTDYFKFISSIGE